MQTQISAFLEKHNLSLQDIKNLKSWRNLKRVVVQYENEEDPEQRKILEEDFQDLFDLLKKDIFLLNIETGKKYYVNQILPDGRIILKTHKPLVEISTNLINLEKELSKLFKSYSIAYKYVHPKSGKWANKVMTNADFQSEVKIQQIITSANSGEEEKEPIVRIVPVQIEGVLKKKQHRQNSKVQIRGAQGFKITRTTVKSGGSTVGWIPTNDYCYLKTLSKAIGKQIKPNRQQDKQGIEITNFVKLLEKYELLEAPVIFPFVYSAVHKFSHSALVYLAPNEAHPTTKQVYDFCFDAFISSTPVVPKTEWQRRVCKVNEVFNQPDLIKKLTIKDMTTEEIKESITTPFVKSFVKPKALPVIVPFDFETLPIGPDSRHVPVMISYSVGLKSEVEVISVPTDTTRPDLIVGMFLETLYKQTVQSQEIVLIAHNSSRFDSFILINYLDSQTAKPINRGKHTIFPNNQLKRLSFEYKDRTINLIDFANFVPQPLKKICQDFKLTKNGEPLRKLEPTQEEQYYRPSDHTLIEHPKTMDEYLLIYRQYLKYNIQDTECLQAAITEYSKYNLQMTGFNFWECSTGSSAAWKHFKNKLPPHLTHYASSKVYQQFIRETIQGGMSMPLIKDTCPSEDRKMNIQEFDVVSLYPAAQVHFQYPVESSVRKCDVGEVMENIKGILSGKIGFDQRVYIATFTLNIQAGAKGRQVLAQKNKDGLRVYRNGVQVHTTFSSMVAMELQLNPETQIIDIQPGTCITYDEYTYDYFKGVKEIFELKNKEKVLKKAEGRGDALYQIYKAFLNHPFGKTIQRPIDTTHRLYWDSPDARIDMFTKSITRINDKGLCIQERRTVTPPINKFPPVIGSLTLCYSKVIMHKYNELITGRKDVNAFLNVETDGAFFECSDPEEILQKRVVFDNKARTDLGTIAESAALIGGFELQNRDKRIERVVSVSPKFYFVQFSDKSRTTKMKGVNLRNVRKNDRGEYVDHNGASIIEKCLSEKVVRFEVPQTLFTRSLTKGIRVLETTKQLTNQYLTRKQITDNGYTWYGSI